MIEVNDLVKKYGAHIAVDHLSFTVEKGQIYGFLGPNGAGKSTTMNMLTGYLGATEGTIKVNGYDILEEAEKAKKSIGYLPEQPPIYMDMTPYEYLRFAAQLKKISKAERESMINEAMALTGVQKVQHRLIKNLSKGYKQRVGLAQAVLGFPEVIILDEPTVGLDPKQIIEIRDLIKELSEKHTIILSSHILSEVSAICDHIMIISKGKLVASDSPKQLSRMMEGSQNLELQVKGAKEDVLPVVQDISGVLSVEIQEGEKQGVVKISIETESAMDIRETLFYRLAEYKLPIYSMNIQKVSLEDIFLQLTGNEEEPVSENVFEEAEEEEAEEDDSDI